MSVAVGIAAGASAQAAVASSQAAKALCVARMPNFDAKTATVQQAREYASCVHRVYGSGEPMDPGAVIALKLIVALSFVGLIAGGVYGWRDSWGDWFDVVMWAVVGAIAPWLAAGVLFLAAAGLQFLFS